MRISCFVLYHKDILGTIFKDLFKHVLTDDIKNLSPLCFLQLLKSEKAKWAQNFRFVTFVILGNLFTSYTTFNSKACLNPV